MNTILNTETQKDVYHEDRPWGSFDQFTHDISSTVKIIRVLPGETLSLQYHTKRDELWYVISGDGVFVVGHEKRDVHVGDMQKVAKGTPHRISGGTELLVILEIATGEFDENDIVRLEDKYGRIPEQKKL